MNRLSQLRKEKNLLQKDIANFLGVAISTYSYWEKGLHDPDNETLKKLATYCISKTPLNTICCVFCCLGTKMTH